MWKDIPRMHILMYNKWSKDVTYKLNNSENEYVVMTTPQEGIGISCHCYPIKSFCIIKK